MIERLEVTPGEGTVIRYGSVAAWAGPAASPGLVSFLTVSARNLAGTAGGGQQLCDHLAGVLSDRDPEPHVPFAVIGPSEDGWVALLHGQVQIWDGIRWITPERSPGWVRVEVWPRPSFAVTAAGQSAPPVQPDSLWDLEAGVVPGQGFALLPAVAGGSVVGPTAVGGTGAEDRTRLLRPDPESPDDQDTPAGAAPGPDGGSVTSGSVTGGSAETVALAYPGYPAEPDDQAAPGMAGGGSPAEAGMAGTGLAEPGTAGDAGARLGEEAEAAGAEPPAAHGGDATQLIGGTAPLPAPSVAPAPLGAEEPGATVAPTWPPDRVGPGEAATVVGRDPVLDLRSDAARSRLIAYPPLPSGSTAGRPVPGAPVVAGVVCRQGHLNRPAMAACVRCGAPIAGDQAYNVTGTRPALGCLVLDDGSVHRLDRGYLAGSDPDRDPTVRGGLARPLVLAGEQVAASHAEIRLHDWDVVITDRDSPGGTFVYGPESNAWERLRPYQPHVLRPGTHIALGQRVATFLTPWLTGERSPAAPAEPAAGA